MWPKRFSYIPAKTEDLAVILAQDHCSIDVDDEKVVADARIVFRPHRFPSAQVELADLEIIVDEGERVSITLETSGFVLRDGILGAQGTNPVSSRYRHRIRQTEPMSFQRPGAPVKVECIVYNLSQFGFRCRPTNGQERLDLNVPNGWKATIGPLEKDLWKDRELFELLGCPGRMPTHSLHLSRTGPECPTAAEVDETLFLLRYFLSFAWGHNIGLGMAQGFSEDGELVYVMPGITRVDAITPPEARPDHWFLPSHAECLDEVLAGFWNRMTDPEWRDYVDWGLYWWLSANHPAQAAETPILASQAGLESLAPAFLRFRLRNSNQGQTAAQTIREMLKILGISKPEVPNTLIELQMVAKDNGFDGPQALTKVRNALAHPSKGDKAGLAFEASQLGMWYLELALLFSFGYQGEVFNRTVFGGPWFRRETVPWATKP